MGPGPFSPFVVATRLAGTASVALASWAALGLGGWACAVAWVAFALSALSLLRVPRRRLLVELALVDLALAGILALAVSGTLAAAPAALAALTLLATLLAPESGPLLLNGLDRFFVVQQYEGTPVNSHVFVDSKEPLDRDVVVRAVSRLLNEVPILRSFVREAVLGSERFVAKRPWVRPEELVFWLDHPVEERSHEVLDAPMDLERRPPFRIVHAPRPEGGFRLALTIHHSAADGTGQFVFLDRFVERYDAIKTGASQPPAPEPPMRRFRDLLRDRSWPWVARMARRHVRPLDKIGVRNASLLDDEAPRPAQLRHHWSELPLETWNRVRSRAVELGVTPNDLLVTASLRAARGWRRAKGKPDRPFRILLPTDLRPLFKLEPCFQNFVEVVRADFTLAEVDAPELPTVVSGRIKEGRTPEEALETPFNLGLLSDLLPPGLFRGELRKFDNDPDSFFFSYLFSHLKLPKKLRLPVGTTPEAVWGRGSLARQPGFGIVIGVWGERVNVVLEYLDPLVSAASVEEIRLRLLEEIDRVGASPAPG